MGAPDSLAMLIISQACPRCFSLTLEGSESIHSTLCQDCLEELSEGMTIASHRDVWDRACLILDPFYAEHSRSTLHSLQGDVDIIPFNCILISGLGQEMKISSGDSVFHVDGVWKHYVPTACTNSTYVI